MTYNDIQFILLIIGFTIFAFIVIPLLKIMVMINVFGWAKTKELLQDPKFCFGNASCIKKKLQRIEGENQ